VCDCHSVINPSSTVCVSIIDPGMTQKHRDFGPFGSWSLQQSTFHDMPCGECNKSDLLVVAIFYDLLRIAKSETVITGCNVCLMPQSYPCTFGDVQ